MEFLRKWRLRLLRRDLQHTLPTQQRTEAHGALKITKTDSGRPAAANRYLKPFARRTP